MGLIFSVLKAQSAIEYLMTYGWMLLVVAVAGGAVFSMVGDQNIESVNGFNSQDVNVRDFGASVKNGLVFALDDFGADTEIREVTVSGSDNVTYRFNQELSNIDMVNLPGVVPADDQSELDIEISYNSGDLRNLVASGTVKGSLEVDESFKNRTMIMEGLVGYWPLDEEYSSDNMVYDLSMNNNHGKMVNSPDVVEGIKGDRALDFDVGENNSRSERIELMRPVDYSGEFTLTMWIDANPEPGWSDTQPSRRGVYHDDIIYFDQKRNENVEVRIGEAEVGGVNDYSYQFDGVRLVVVRYDGSNLELIRGTQVLDSQSLSSVSAPSVEPWFAGNYEDSLRHWSGIMDEVKMYDRALSNEEIEVVRTLNE